MSEKNEFHYFANHAIGWVTADTEDEAVEKLLLQNTDPSWARNCLKAGEFIIVFVCRVPLASTAPYKIEWYRPVVDGITESKNLIVTYLTKAKYATAPDPNDKIDVLKNQIDEYVERIEELVAEIES